MTTPTGPPDFGDMATILGETDEPKQHPPGTVIVLASEAARYSEFWISKMRMIQPPGATVKVILGSDISESRNQGIDEMEGEWVWFIDDDHSFHPDTLLRLLDAEVDIVTPICLRRDSLLAIPVEGDNYLDFRKHGPDDLVEVTHAGSSGMLIRKPVIDALAQPYFELGHRQKDGNRLSEDVVFCQKAQEAGFKIHVDLAVPISHMVVASVWPSWNTDQNRWMTTVSIASANAHLWIEPTEVPPQEDSPGLEPS
jgi:hypothetical protein